MATSVLAAILARRAWRQWTAPARRGLTGLSGSALIHSDSTGTLKITNGATVSSSYGYVGYYSGSTGMATVDGTGSTWTSGTLYVYTGMTGMLSIKTVDTVNSIYGYLSGVATVDGTGSTWSNTGSLYVGNSGTGTLNITNGGVVTAVSTTYVGYSGGAGTINFGPGGGTLTTKSLYASPTQLTGTGTINTRGLLSDVNLVFDSTHGLDSNQWLWEYFVLNLDMSDSSNVGSLGAGWNGNGSLT